MGTKPILLHRFARDNKVEVASNDLANIPLLIGLFPSA